MGIAGLLPALKSVTHQVHIAKYAGKTVGIDAAGWLYRGAYSCPMDVVLRTKNADGCVQSTIAGDWLDRFLYEYCCQ